MKQFALKFWIITLSIIIANKGYSQVYKDQFVHTFSIVARDSKTGEMAVAVQSHWFAVGTSVAWGRSGVGVVATQSFINPAYGPEGLDLMEKGMSAGNALKVLINKDEGRNVRQVAMLDVHGNVSAYTGKNCIVYADDITGDNFSVQANMMLTDKVVPAMAEAFRKYSNLPLAERVLEVLKAAQEAGGDIRGSQAAAILVVGPKKVNEPWNDKLVDLRIDDHPYPLKELERLLRIHRAYNHMNKGDLAIEHNDMKRAMAEYGAAQRMFPDNLEMKYWTAVALANSGDIKKAKKLFREVFNKDKNWKELTRRLPKSGLLKVSNEDFKKILSL